MFSNYIYYGISNIMCTTNKAKNRHLTECGKRKTDWCQSLERKLQGSENKKKKKTLTRCAPGATSAVKRFTNIRQNNNLTTSDNETTTDNTTSDHR